MWQVIEHILSTNSIENLSDLSGSRDTPKQDSFPQCPSLTEEIRMKGLVNYYIEEDPDNYQVIRGETDVYKFTLDKTQVGAGKHKAHCLQIVVRLSLLTRWPMVWISSLTRRV